MGNGLHLTQESMHCEGVWVADGGSKVASRGLHCIAWISQQFNVDSSENIQLVCRHLPCIGLDVHTGEHATSRSLCH